MTTFTNFQRQTNTPAASGFAILHGTLAPEGCVVKLDGFITEVFDGPARVFGSTTEALDGIARGRVRACDIMIIRHDGEDITVDGLRAVTTALDEANVERVTVITDGRAGGAEAGAIIGHVAPSAAARGPIAYVNDDDIIHIDIAARRIDVMADIELRRAAKVQKPGKTVFGAGALEKYARMVTS
ncbi:MAG: dihydroxy-acid dehydratase, partial [Asticcacaulis sp.]|nr:dihydroxy-acid dehydratase [Asticcacaulis sp.]